MCLCRSFSPFTTERPNDLDVPCTPACPADCQTPATSYVSWELSECPKPGEAWTEEMSAAGCKVQCVDPEQQMLFQCKDGVVTADPELKDCLPAEWQPNDGPCSASCGGGTFTRQWYCASESKRDEDCDITKKPDETVLPCASNNCYGSATNRQTDMTSGAVSAATTSSALLTATCAYVSFASIFLVQMGAGLMVIVPAELRGRRHPDANQPVQGLHGRTIRGRRILRHGASHQPELCGPALLQLEDGRVERMFGLLWWGQHGDEERVVPR